MDQLQPVLRFSGFEEGYRNILFKDIIDNYGYGPRFNANDYSEFGNVKTIRGTDVSIEGEIKYQQVPTAQLDENTIKTHKLKDGDLVMITTADCGLTGVFRQQNIDYIPSAYAVRITLNEKGYPIFFKYFLQTQLAKFQVDKFIRKATVANLPGSDILRFSINIPSFPEQTKIATFLSAVDEKLNLLKEKKVALEEYKKGMMQKIFSQEIRFKDENGKDFETWEEKTISEICTKKSSNISANKIEENFGEYFIYGASGVLKKIDFYKEENDYVSIVKDGAGVGRLLYCKGKSSVLGTLEIISPKVNLNTYFLYCLLSNIDFTKYVTGSTIPHIYFKDYSLEKCGLPSLNEQTKIANILSAIDEKIALIATQIEDTQEYKKGLLQGMFC